MKLRAKAVATASVVALSCVTMGSVASATGQSKPPPVRTVSTEITSTGTIEGRTHIKQDKIELKTKSSSLVTAFTLVYPPGSYSGWHSHPGIVVAIVTSGSVDRQTGCKIEHFTKGDAFTEVGTHRVSNSGEIDAVLEITQIYPEDAAAGRIDQEDPCTRHPTP
jgi:quercetin dioxygenase-like cupin family protein